MRVDVADVIAVETVPTRIEQIILMGGCMILGLLRGAWRAVGAT